MKYKNILFDLDGTLTDPGVGIINGLKYALNKFDLTENNDDRLKQFIGPPLEKGFMEYYKFDQNKAKEAVKYYREYYSEKGIYENVLYPDIENLLKYVTESGRICMLATSKPQEYALRIINYFSINNYFNYVAGSNLDGTLSEKEEIIYKVLTDNNLAKPKTVMVGDRKHDIIGAKKNNIDSIAVLYGYGTSREIKDTNPTYICNKPLDILELI